MNIIGTFAILFATALADVLLYALVGDALMCYRCDALYRGVEEMEIHGSFNLETHEKYRQQAARLKEQTQSILGDSNKVSTNNPTEDDSSS